MIQSSQPRKQRLFRFNAPMHERQHFVHSHIDKALRAKLNIKKRAIQISKGDTVKIVSGGKKGTTGKVIRVNLRTGKINLDSLVKKTARGKEYNLPIDASNVYITDLNLSDKVRAAKLKVAQQKQSAPIKSTNIGASANVETNIKVEDQKK
jgi:large subunit ribosomal protein L24